MRDWTVVEWDNAAVWGVVGTAHPEGATVRQVLFARFPAELDRNDASAVSRWFRGELDRQGIKLGNVVLCLPREEAVVKRLEFPNVPDAELPALVRFQAASKSAVPLADLALDFLPLPHLGKNADRDVLLATVPRQELDRYRQVLRDAGGTLAGVTLTPTGLSEVVARLPQPQEQSAASANSTALAESTEAGRLPVELIVSRMGLRVEIALLRDGGVWFTHATRLSAEPPDAEQQAVVAEVSRALVSLRARFGTVTVTRVWLCDAPAAHPLLVQALRTRLGAVVLPCDPWTVVTCAVPCPVDSADWGRWAGPLGVLAGLAERKTPGLDFLNPRQPPVVKDLRRRRRWLVGSAAGVLGLGIVGGYAWELQRLDKSIGLLTSEDRHLDKLLQEGTPKLKQAQLVRDWQRKQVEWFEDFRTLQQQFPPTDRLYLTAWQGEPAAGNGPRKIKLTGLAREQHDVIAFHERLVRLAPRFRVLPHAIRQASTDNRYPWRFETEILIQPAETTASLPAAGVPKSNPPASRVPRPAAAVPPPSPEERRS